MEMKILESFKRWDLEKNASKKKTPVELGLDEYQARAQLVGDGLTAGNKRQP